jgi:NDP-sugar pyrophosphorylase family protein
VECGIRDFVFVVSPDDHQIRTHFTRETDLEMSARFVLQQRRLGTAHALQTAANLIEGPCAVWACDSLVDRDHVKALLAAMEGADAALSLLEVAPELVSRSASVELDGDRVRRIIEKPPVGEAPSNTVSLPHYVFSRKVLDLLSAVEESSRGEYELPDAIQKAVDGGGLVVGVRASRRIQVSSPRDLLALNRQLLRDHDEHLRVPTVDVGRDVELIKPLWIGEGVVIPNGCEIGPEVYLESGCRIGGQAVVRRSIVLRDGEVAEDEIIEDQVVT